MRRRENGRNSMKKTENINLLILGSRTGPGFITTLNKMLWSATGALKPMDQKSYIYIYIYTFVILNSGF
jgi:hypothetical protein